LDKFSKLVTTSIYTFDDIFDAFYTSSPGHIRRSHTLIIERTLPRINDIKDRSEDPLMPF